MVKNSLEEAKEKYNISCCFCDALLLQFKRPIVYDLTIPDAYNIYSLLVISGRIMNGKKIDPTKVNCLTTAHGRGFSNFLYDKHFSKLSKKVSEGLLGLFNDTDVIEPFLNHYLSSIKSRFASEWIMNYGTLFRYREGEKKNAEQRVKNYFNNKELAEFDKIGEIIQPYIKLTNSAAKVN